MQSTETRPVAPPTGGPADRRPLPKPPSPRGATSFQAVLVGEEPRAGSAGPGALPKVRERREDDGKDEASGRDAPRSPFPVGETRSAPIRETFAVAAPAVSTAPDAAQVQSLAETMLRTLRIGGDGRGGHEARMQIGSGAWAGTSIRIALQGGRLSATITPGDSGDPTELADRLSKALAARGVPMDAIEVG